MENFRPQIDGLRAIAMTGVFYVHFWNPAPLTEHIRVTLFLVVSGFLITHVLMTARESGGRLSVINFYIRRLLRLAPALLVALSVAYALDADGFRQSVLWHALPLTNVYFAMNGGVDPWPVVHLWSLSLLEQFYLVWPLVVLLLPPVGFYMVNILGVALVFFLRNNADQLGISSDWVGWVIAYDPIFIGALTYQLQKIQAARQLLSDRGVFEIAALVLASPLFLWDGFGNSESYRLLADCAIAVIVMGAFAGYTGVLGAVLQWAPLRFIAKISYGAYVYHLVLWYIVAQIAPALYSRGPVTFAFMSALTLAVAALSWYLIEAPIGRLKRFYPTREAPRPAAVLADQP